MDTRTAKDAQATPHHWQVMRNYEYNGFSSPTASEEHFEVRSWRCQGRHVSSPEHFCNTMNSVGKSGGKNPSTRPDKSKWYLSYMQAFASRWSVAYQSYR
jgi:hypothetical protein